MTELTKMICVGGTGANSRPSRGGGAARPAPSVPAVSGRRTIRRLPQIPVLRSAEGAEEGSEPVVEEEDEPPPPPPSEDGVLGACRDDDREAEARGLPALDPPTSDNLEEAVRARFRRAADETLAVSQDADETVSEFREQLEVEKEVAEEVEGERTKIEVRPRF